MSSRALRLAVWRKYRWVSATQGNQYGWVWYYAFQIRNGQVTVPAWRA